MIFETLEGGVGLDVVLWLQEGRVDWLNALVEFLNFAGYQFFYIAALALIYWIVDRRLGLRMFFALAIIALLTINLKEFFGRPRPFQVSGMVTPLFDAASFGLPSGHTAVSMVVWGVLALWYKKTWLTIAVSLYVLLQGFGRIYAGVHFPQDVLGGLLLGAVTLAIYWPLSQPVANWWNQRQAWQQVSLALALSGVGMVVYAGSEGALSNVGLLLGGALATTMTTHYFTFETHTARSRQAVQYVVGVAISVAVLIGLDLAFGTLEPADLLRVIRYALVAWVALALWPWISVKLGLMQPGQATQS